MKNTFCYLALLSLAPMAHGDVILGTGHIDIGIAYEDKNWDLHIHNETTDTEYAPGEARFQLGLNTLSTVPGSPDFAFLGSPGSSFYLLPNVQSTDRVFLGVGAEELQPPDWSSNIRLTLKAVEGPGSFYVWDNDSFGRPVVRMNSNPLTGGGIDSTDAIEIVPGSHGDVNWAFSAPGTYTASFEASGTHALDGVTASGPVAYRFEVVPEPGTVALGLAGFIACCFWGRRRESP